METESFERKLAAIVAADVVGYSRLMGADEADTLTRLKSLLQECMEPKIAEYNGRIVKLMGDGILVEFASVVDALAGAVELQRAVASRNQGISEDKQILFRVGINLGDIIVEGEDIFGDGVNIAARLEGLAEPGGICISQMVRDGVSNKLQLSYEDMGEQQVKNIADPVRAYSVQMPADAIMPAASSGRSAVLSQSFSRRRLWPALAAVVIVAIIGAFFLIYQPKPVPQVAVASEANMAFPLPVKPSIAVLPFENLSGDSEQSYLVDGITENIITTLAKIPKLFVIARNTTFTYKEITASIKQVSEDLGVRYILQGSVQHSGDRVRIGAKLIDELTGQHLWADDYDRKLEDIFELQDDITEHVVTELEVKLTDGESARLRRDATNSPQAYLLLLQGRELFNKADQQSSFKAQQLFKQALTIDPNFSKAWIYVGWIHVANVQQGWSDDRTGEFKKALEVAQKVLTIDEFDADAYALMGSIYRYQGLHEKGIPLQEKALTLNPNNATNMALLAAGLLQIGQPKRCLSLVEKAMRLNPSYPSWMLSIVAFCNFRLGASEEANTAQEEYRRRVPVDIPGLTSLAAMYADAGLMDKAHTAVEAALKIDPDYSIKKYPLQRYKDDVLRQLFYNNLVKAGVPE